MNMRLNVVIIRPTLIDAVIVPVDPEGMDDERPTIEVALTEDVTGSGAKLLRGARLADAEGNDDMEQTVAGNVRFESQERIPDLTSGRVASPRRPGHVVSGATRRSAVMPDHFHGATGRTDPSERKAALVRWSFMAGKGHRTNGTIEGDTGPDRRGMLHAERLPANIIEGIDELKRRQRSDEMRMMREGARDVDRVIGTVRIIDIGRRKEEVG